MIHTYFYGFILIALCHLSLTFATPRRRLEIFSPEVLLPVPMLLAIIAYSLGLSDFYESRGLELLYLYQNILFFVFGCFLVRAPAKFQLSINMKRLPVAVVGTALLACSAFLLIASFKEVPYFSPTPNQAYVNFGLPIISHFVNLFFIAGALAVLNFKSTGNYFLLGFVVVLATAVYSVMTQRLSLIILVISIVGIYLSSVHKPRFFLMLLVAMSTVLCFLGMFIVIESVRLAGVWSGYKIFVSGVSQDWLPEFLVLPYMYLTSGVASALILISELEFFGYGSAMIQSVVPFGSSWVHSFADDRALYQVAPSFTTLSFPAQLFLDFGYFSVFTALLLGVVSRFLYDRGKRRIEYALFYYVYVAPKLTFSFFSDGFFSSSLFFMFGFSILIGGFIKGRSFVR